MAENYYADGKKALAEAIPGSVSCLNASNTHADIKWRSQEHHRQAERLTQWRICLVMEPGLWSSSVLRKWRLDETEGPYRMRFICFLQIVFVGRTHVWHAEKS